MNKIAVIGSPGAGKSTLSRQLKELTRIQVYHLDVLHWNPNWVIMPKDEQKAIQEEIVNKKEWIIDGNYGGTLDIRLNAADTIVFLDFPRHVCLYRVIKRAIIYRNKRRPDMREGNKERIDFEFYKFVWRFYKDKRPAVLKKIEAYSDTKTVIHLCSRREVDAFLRSIQALHKGEYYESMDN